MKTKVTKQELKECVMNAVNRILKEGNWQEFDGKQCPNKHERDRQFGGDKPKKPNHSKMAPAKKEKYRNTDY